MRNIKLAIILMTLFACGLTACETMEGAGRDIQKAGGAIERAADR